MATYEEIYGKRVDVLDADPTLSSAYEGQVWYNSTTGTLKTVVSSAAWSSSSSMITGREWLAGMGTQTSALAAGGYALPPTKYALSEEYNGSGWATGGTMNTARGELAGGGTQTAGLIAGGDVLPGASNAAETYNGATWTNAPSLNTARFGLGAAKEGTTTAALVFGGGSSDVSEEFNGTSWTEGENLNTARNGLPGSCAGTQTAALATGGSPFVAVCEEYNGASWATVNSLNTARQQAGGGGSQTTAFVAGGQTPPNTKVTATETYDGTTWTTSPATLGTAMYANAGAGNNTTGLSFGGDPQISSTEELNVSISTFTPGAWAAAPSLNTTRANVGRSGIAPTQNAAMCVSGYPGPPSTIDVKNVEEFDGSSWTEIADVNSQRYGGMCAGTTTAGLFFGGNSDVTPGTKPLPLSEEWNGTSWTEGGNMNDGNESGGALGTQTAALQAGGSLNPYPNYTNTSEEYNGASWTNVPATIFAAVSGVTGVGTQTAGLIFCGNQTPPPGTNFATAQTYNGTAYTTVNSCVETGNKLVGGGTQTAAFGAGGGPGAKSRVQHYDGTTWSTAPSLGTGRSASSGGAPQAAGIYFAGNPGSGGSTTAAEQFTAGSTTVAAKTLTTS